MAEKPVPGTIYQNHGRYYWRVTLPGQPRKAIPLRPKGAAYATKDPGVAMEVAKTLYHQYLFATEQPDITAEAGPLSTQKPQTIAELARRYQAFAAGYYESEEPRNIKYALTWLVDAFAAMPVQDFSPKRLKDVRAAMIAAGLARGVVNQRTNIIKRMFRWAVSEELCHPNILYGLDAVAGLRKGKKENGLVPREPEKVKPVVNEHVQAAIDHAPAVVAAMIRVQLLTGMRSSELCIMQPRLIDRGENIWLYYPDKYKGQHIEGYERVIPLGPQAQEVLGPYLLRADRAYLFTPAEAHRQRVGNTGCTTAKRYDRRTYRQAVQYAIGAANKAIQAACGDAAEYQAKKIPLWTPHRLRHNRGTIIRKKMGLEAAKAALGQKSLNAAEIYAEQDFQRAVEAAKRFG